MFAKQEQVEKPSVTLTSSEITAALGTLGEKELLELRDRIDARIPKRSLSQLDLEDEGIRQYASLKDIQNMVLSDESLPLNQRAQLANSCAAALDSLVRRQTELYTSERFKIIEGLVIKYMKRLPVDVAQAFLADYERLA